ncbi:hypothetical protein B0H14DRAFT_2901345 [Mycena olivaceomarginata]|nr:hypothetical protein B0H14DRAFT_2901345 [Mycena olivaceomarginata]
MSSVNAGLRARLARVDASILELTLRWESLEDTRQSIQRQLDSVVYPILTLPHEITDTDVTKAPLLLLQVCRTWRDIALSDATFMAIADWFLRAGACPLFPQYCDQGDQSWQKEAIPRRSSSSCSRLQSISLRLSRPDFHRLVNIVAIPFEFYSDEEERGAAVPSIFLLSYEGLSTVTCESLSPDDFFDLLLCAPSLEKFTGRCERRRIVRLDTVTHGHLQTLHLSNGSYLYFLRLLHLPAIQNIHLATTIATDECPDFLSAFNELDTDQFFTCMPLFGPPEEFLLDFIQKLDRAQDKLFLPQLQNLAGALTSRCIGDDESSILRSFRVDALPSYDNDNESRTTALHTLVERGISKFPNTALANDSQVN